MSMVSIELSGVGFGELESALLAGQRQLKTNLHTFIRDAGQLMGDTMQTIAPVGPTERYKDSMLVEPGQEGDVYFTRLFSTDDTGKVLALEFGRTSSRRPPLAAILSWVQWKGIGGFIEARRVQRAIAEGRSRGKANPPGHAPFERTFVQIEQPVYAMAMKIVEVF